MSAAGEKEEKMRRYFLFTLVFYLHNTHGHTSVLYDSANVPSHEDIAYRASRHAKSKSIMIEPDRFIITNMFEFKNKEDYDFFVSAREP